MRGNNGLTFFSLSIGNYLEGNEKTFRHRLALLAKFSRATTRIFRIGPQSGALCADGAVMLTMPCLPSCALVIVTQSVCDSVDLMPGDRRMGTMTFQIEMNFFGFEFFEDNDEVVAERMSFSTVEH